MVPKCFESEVSLVSSVLTRTDEHVNADEYEGDYLCILWEG